MGTSDRFWAREDSSPATTTRDRSKAIWNEDPEVLLGTAARRKALVSILIFSATSCRLLMRHSYSLYRLKRKWKRKIGSSLFENWKWLPSLILLLVIFELLVLFVDRTYLASISEPCFFLLFFAPYQLELIICLFTF